MSKTKTPTKEEWPILYSYFDQMSRTKNDNGFSDSNGRDSHRIDVGRIIFHNCVCNVSKCSGQCRFPSAATSEDPADANEHRMSPVLKQRVVQYTVRRCKRHFIESKARSGR